MKLLSSVRDSMNYLNLEDRKKIIYLALQGSLLGLLEIISVGLSGILVGGALSILSGSSYPSWYLGVSSALNLAPTRVSLVIGIGFLLALAVLVIKNLLAIRNQKRILLFLAEILISQSNRLFHEILEARVQFTSMQDHSRIRYLFNQALPNVLIGNLAYAIQALSELTLILLLAAYATIISPIITCVSLGIFFLLALFTNKITSRNLNEMSVRYTNGQVREMQLLDDLLFPIREHKTYLTGEKLAQRFSKEKSANSANFALLLWLQQLPKYYYEVVGLAGTGLICWVALATLETKDLVLKLLILVIVVSRLTPSFLRLQQALLALKASVGASDSLNQLKQGITLELANLDDSNQYLRSSLDPGSHNYLEIRNVFYKFPDSSEDSLNGINLVIERGEILGVVGPSGAGKTTLADAILGLCRPQRGEIEFYSLDTKDSNIRSAYVPQKIQLIHGSVLENIVFFEEDLNGTQRDRATVVLEMVGLEEGICSLPSGLDTVISNEDPKLSGGQVQRLGICRALFRDPSLLIMDEATSGLDAESEGRISEFLEGSKGKMTIIVIAHRLSTIRNLPRIIYMENGKIIAEGSFQKVRELVPEFDNQATLLGL
jgi:ABC-type multidrug transport system fused ATPase/permease subunit